MRDVSVDFILRLDKNQQDGKSVQFASHSTSYSNLSLIFPLKRNNTR